MGRGEGQGYVGELMHHDMEEPSLFVLTSSVYFLRQIRNGRSRDV